MTTFEEAIEETGHGWFNYIVLLTSGLILLYTIVESLGVGYIITAAECDLGLSVNEKGMINAAAFIGIFSTAIFWGYLSDRFGRRAVMLPATAASIVLSFASSLSTNFCTLFVLRFLTGCLVSASSATVYAYLGEMHTDARRSSAIAYGSTFIAFTFIVLPVLAWLIISGKNWSFNMGTVKIVPWRVFIWSWCTPGLMAAIILIFLPESPRYLFAVKGQDQAIPVLARIYAWNQRKKKEDYPVKSITKVTEAIAQRGFCKAFKNLGQLGRPPLLRCMLISHMSMFLIFCLSSGLYTWMPHILNQILLNIDKPVSMCDVVVIPSTSSSPETCSNQTISTRVFQVSIAMGIICSIVYVFIGYVMHKRQKIGIYCTCLAVCSLLLSVSSVVPQLVVAVILFITGLCCGCAASVLAAIAVEVFPTNVRALALCTMYMAGRSGAAVGAILIGLGIRGHCLVVFFGITLTTAGSTLLMLFWPDPKAVRTVMEERGFAY